MRTGTIPSSWLGITGTWSAQALLDVRAEVDRLGIDPSDTAAVRKVWLRIGRLARERLAELDRRAKARHNEALADARERERLLNTTRPAKKW